MKADILTKRTICIIIAAILLVSLLPLCSFADKDTVVKIGYYSNDTFQEGTDDDAVKTGYAYEFYQKVAYETGWKYEYVYGDWGTMFDMLTKGEIDIMAGVSYSEERAKVMDFPNQRMGYEAYYLFKHSDENGITASNLESLNGKKVGCMENNFITFCYLDWAVENNIDTEIVYFTSFDDLEEAFKNREIDLLAQTDNNVSIDLMADPLVCVGQSDYYFAVAKDREDILNELNQALDTIYSENSNFISELRTKYFTQRAVNVALNFDEQKWIKEHGKIVIGYNGSYLPFSGQDADGNVTGVIKDICAELPNALSVSDKLKIECVCYDDFDKLAEALEKGKVDAIFPVCSSTWHSENYGIHETASIVTVPLSIIYNGEYTDDIFDKIAYSNHGPMQEIYADIYKPQSEKVLCTGTEDCLEKVMSGEATYTVFTSYRADYYLSQDEYSSLNCKQLGDNMGYCFGVKRGNSTLYGIMNKGVLCENQSVVTGLTYKYSDMPVQTYSAKDFLKDNIEWILIIAVVVLSGFVFTQIRYSKNLKKALKTAEDANSAKTRFLFNMSHDIRTPMNAILGYTNMAQRNIDDISKVIDCLNKTERAGDTLLSIINDVLEMSRIDEGKTTLKESKADVYLSFAHVEDVAKELASAKKIDIDFSFGEIRDRYVWYDLSYANRILMNLISNAVKYTNDGGWVKVKCEQVESEKEGYATFKYTVSDNGIGMSEEFVKKAFDQFSREENPETAKVQGTGLGLALCKRFANMLGGTITCESVQGEGSTFTFIIPCRIRDDSDAESKDNINAALTDEKFSGKRILLVEDNEMNREIATDILSDAGFTVIEAEDGKKAINAIKSDGIENFDAILMDIQMPYMDGYETTKMIRLLYPYSPVPIIALSANAFEEDKKKSIDSGMNDHIAKPIRIDVLKKTLAKYL